MLSELRDKHADVLKAIRTEGEISDDTEGKLKEFFDGFTKSFA